MTAASGATNTQMLKKLDEVLDAIHEIRQQEAARNEREASMKQSIAEHEQFINGNGKPGLKSEFAVVKQDISRINWIGGVLLVAVIGDIVARIMAK